MSPSHLPRDKKDRSVRARKHDLYKAKGKLREPSVCRQCKAVYHKDRWTWDPVSSDREGEHRNPFRCPTRTVSYLLYPAVSDSTTGSCLARVR